MSNSKDYQRGWDDAMSDKRLPPGNIWEKMYCEAANERDAYKNTLALIAMLPKSCDWDYEHVGSIAVDMAERAIREDQKIPNL